ncbi:MAG: hypothetical protein CMF52_09455 [Legionellales bacterium]|nr:hypothetical protein [Legionellales bacterium]
MDIEDMTILQPLEWFGDDLEQGLEHVENAAYSMIESGASSSLIEDMPMLDPRSLSTIINKAESLHDGWGIKVFKHIGIDVWFALIGTEEMFEENTFARANGNDDMAIAIGDLKIDRVCEAVRYNKDTKHHIIPRDKNGNYMRTNLKDRAKKYEIIKAKVKERQEKWRTWNGSSAWNAKLKKWIGRRGPRRD